ncbi:hypothetical protein [Flavobacterium okayamense]|uniref:Uncharacterized protein n=1 Tax=Flavobacterium okayamense TaxID=2830782 RepID=A0ABM7S389_9FLAO|nr:hypothetical protein [Flavobacterium okayamense]BCY27576.1 hypothetical protein KK2020170_04440 [Flavobacterium okayamense]
MSIINTIQLLFYKENPELLEKIDFENEAVFQEPLLFAYFNNKTSSLFSTAMLTEIIQGYFVEKEPLLLNESYNKEGIAYLPNLGYFDEQGNKVDDVFLIKNSSIELLIHPIIHLKHIFKDFNENAIDTSKIEISKDLCKRHENALSNAFLYIKSSNKEHFDLIEQCCKKIVLFKTDPKNTNSFATINAHGIAFFNVYQDDYDEVFFVDDIAHQTGHVIMTTILFERKKYFIIDENQNIGSLTKNKSEYRSFYILFHALYTYYTTILCLGACLENNCFNKRQTHEAKARIGFYLLKYKSDLLNFEKVIQHYKSIGNILTNDGISLFKMIANKYVDTNKKYDKIVSKFNYNNQPYNFTFRDFIKKNPIPND